LVLMAGNNRATKMPTSAGVAALGAQFPLTWSVDERAVADAASATPSPLDLKA
jgi:hypothetical protein